MSAPTQVWGAAESARLTATLIVADGNHMPAKGLDEAELRACVEMAHERKVRRAVLARRLGWRTDRLYKWCVDRDLAFPEDDFPEDPLKWFNRQFNYDLAQPNRFRTPRGQGR